MTDDPIKAARWAAGDAARRAMIKPGCCLEGTGCELPPCHCSQVAADAAVAAFLRALHPWAVFQGHGDPPIPGRLGSGTLHDIAAAVARAAQEGGR